MLDISINFRSTVVCSASLYGQYSKVWRCNAFFPLLLPHFSPALSIDRPFCVFATSNGLHMTTGQAQTRVQALSKLTTISLQEERRGRGSLGVL